MGTLEDPLLTISQVAKRSGVAASALRFYEARGLLSSVRSGPGHRRYRRSSLRRIAFIVFAQRVGYSLDEIGEQLASIVEGATLNGRDWRRLSSQWQARVQQRIAELQRLNTSLDQCIGCGCLSVKQCKLTNPDDRAGRNGPGARTWLGDFDPKP